MSEATLVNQDTASVESEIHCDSCDEAVLCESRLRGFEDLGSVLRFMYCPWKVNLGRAASRLDSQIPDCRFLERLSPHLYFLRSKRREL